MTIVPGQAAPGAVLTLSAVYRNDGESVTRDARLLLEVPAGTALVPGSLRLNGQVPAQVDVGDAANQMQVPLGDLAVGAGGVARYQVQVAAVPAAPALGITVRIRYQDEQDQTVTEVVGSAHVPVVTVSMLAPSLLGDLSTTLSGQAPANSTVRVYDGNVLLGETEASPAGTWRLPVTFPDTGSHSRHRLHARADTGTATELSPEVASFYDPNQPRLTRVTMWQLSGRTVSFDPAAGVARFPFVLALLPPETLYFSLGFEHADRVYDVKVHLRGEVDQELNAEMHPGGTFSASVRPGWAGMEDIAVTFKTRPAPEFWLQPKPASEEEARAFMPSWAKDFVMLEPPDPAPVPDGACNPGPVTHRARIGLPQANDTEMAIEVSVECGLSLPSGATQVEEYLPVWGLAISGEDVAGKGVVTLEAYIPEDVLVGADPGAALAYLMRAAAARAGGSAGTGEAVLRGASVAALKYVRVFTKVDLATQLSDFQGTASGGVGLDDNYQKLLDLHDRTNGCSGTAAQDYRNQLDDMHTKLLAGEIAKAAMAVMGIVMGPHTAGLGTVAFWALGNIVNMTIDAKVANDLRSLERSINADPDCRRRDPRRDPPVAAPVWIYDPSGYVYEAVEANRLEGVTATILNKDGSGVWTFWDAEWFGQENPQVTDGQGRYGWDVPLGWWQVAYTKEGYESAYSAELEVTPPHFDVNIGMISLAPPAVENFAAAAGGGSIDITFSKYMRTATLSGSNITVTPAGGGEPIAGSVTTPGAVTDPRGTPLTKTVRFTPTAPLSVGASYSVTVSQLVQSYAERPMAADVSITVTIPAVGEVTALQVTPGQNQFTLTWTDPAEAALAGALVYWRPQGSDSYAGPATVAPGVQTHTIGGLTGGTAYQIKVATVDQTGNESGGVTLSATTTAPPVPAQPAAPPPDTNPPGPVTGTAAGRADGGLLLTWADPADADLAAVRVYWRLAGASAYAGPAEVARGVKSHTIAGLLNGKRYEVKLTTVDLAGNESSAVPLTAIPGDNVPPAPVTGLAVMPGDGVLTLIWTDPADADLASVRLRWRNRDAGGNSVTAGISTGVQRYTFTGLVNGTAYEMELAAMDLSGNESPAVSLTGTPTALLTDGEPVQPGPGELVPPGAGEPVRPDDGIAAPSDPDTAQWTADQAAARLEAFGGEVSVDLRAETFAPGTQLAVRRLTGPPEPDRPGLISASQAYELDGGDPGAAPQQPVWLSIRYDPSQVTGLDPRQLGVYRQEEGDPPRYTYVGGAVDSTAQTIRTRVAGFGRYIVMAYDRSFDDLEGHWGQQEVQVLVARHLVQGASAQEFQPDRPITRAELAKLLVLMLAGDPEAGARLTPTTEGVFSDVATDAWYADHVEAAVRLGLIKGSDGRFRPDDPVTRQEMAVMFLRALGLEPEALEAAGEPLPFADAGSVAPWARGFVALAKGSGLMNGVGPDEFAPGAGATRVQAAAVVVRAMNRLGLITVRP